MGGVAKVAEAAVLADARCAAGVVHLADRPRVGVAGGEHERHPVAAGEARQVAQVDEVLDK